MTVMTEPKKKQVKVELNQQAKSKNEISSKPIVYNTKGLKTNEKEKQITLPICY